MAGSETAGGLQISLATQQTHAASDRLLKEVVMA